MSKTTIRLAALALVAVLAACEREPLYPLQYTSPAPPPLMPYVGPPLTTQSVTTTRRRIVRRHYVRRRHHRRVRCQCLPAQ